MHAYIYNKKKKTEPAIATAFRKFSVQLSSPMRLGNSAFN